MGILTETVARTGIVYGLSDDEGWALLGHEETEEGDDPDILPLFHHPAVAEAFRKGVGFSGMHVEQMAVEELKDWLKELEETGTLVTLLPNTHMEGIVVSAEECIQLLVPGTKE